MMLNRMCILAVAILTMCAATTGYAVVDIGNFDDGTTQGWEATGATLAATSTDFDNAIHATTGDHALNVFMPPAANFVWALQLDNNDIPNLGALLASNPMVVADVSWTTSEWNSDPDGVWNRWDASSINSDIGWRQTADSDMTDSANPGFPGSWDVNNYGDSHQRTIMWDFSSHIAGSEAALAASSFVQLNLATNFDSNFDTGNGYSFWIDSIRLVPEPTTISLIGVAGACVFMRRRR
jgi:hypothetical protein